MGIFCEKDNKLPKNEGGGILNSIHTIEFARYAASDHASTTNSLHTHFGIETARKILYALRDLKLYKQGYADFEKMRSLGVESASVLNAGALISSRMDNARHALDLYEAASKLAPDTLIYKTNFGTAAYTLSEVERGLQVLNTIPKNKLEEVIKLHPYGYVAYARLLAKAKIEGMANFDAERFSLMANEALNLEGYKGAKNSAVIADAINM